MFTFLTYDCIRVSSIVQAFKATDSTHQYVIFNRCYIYDHSMVCQSLQPLCPTGKFGYLCYKSKATVQKLFREKWMVSTLSMFWSSQNF